MVPKYTILFVWTSCEYQNRICNDTINTGYQSWTRICAVGIIFHSTIQPNNQVLLGLGNYEDLLQHLPSKTSDFICDDVPLWTTLLMLSHRSPSLPVNTGPRVQQQGQPIFNKYCDRKYQFSTSVGADVQKYLELVVTRAGLEYHNFSRSRRVAQFLKVSENSADHNKTVHHFKTSPLWSRVFYCSLERDRITWWQLSSEQHIFLCLQV